MPRLGLGLGVGNLIGKSLFTPTTPTQTTWDLVISVNSLASDQNLFRIQLFGTGPNITVDWGDGSVETFTTTGSKDHLYASTGFKTVKISGSFVADGRIVVRRSPINAAQIYSTSVIPYIPNLTSFQNTFTSQTSLDVNAPLPAGLFANNPQVTSFRSCFQACSLDGPDIPVELFANNINVTDFAFCFSQNTDTLTTIPEGLFANNVNVTTFASCFANAYYLTEIPAGLFTNNPLVTSFSGCFNEAGIDIFDPLIIPEGLFDSNVNVTTFAVCFQSCVNLTTVPSGLFANNVNVTSFSGVFGNVTLTTPSYSNLLINMASNAAARQSNVAFGGGNSKYNTAGATARATLAAKPWTFTDGGPE